MSFASARSAIDLTSMRLSVCRVDALLSAHLARDPTPNAINQPSKKQIRWALNSNRLMALAAEKKHALLLGRYEMGKLLGQGTFAKVYHARNAQTGEDVAIKIIDKEKILKDGLISHIKREVSNLRRVRHPNIVQLFEVMATKAKIYFVMEYVKGGELFNKVAKGRLKEEVARRYFQQLVSAVGFCHGRGVFHRDLKPENLLLDENGDLKVSDFGLSAVSDQIRQDGLFHTFCGTPAYVAPEVLARKGYDAAKVDVWSSGVILFVLMAGYLPFQDPNVMVMYRKIYKGQFRCPRWFSPELVKLLRRLMDINPETRITIPEIMENRWFKKGFKRLKFYVEDDHQVCNLDDEAGESDDPGSASDQSESDNEQMTSRRKVTGMPRPASMNAFDIISYSSGFDLSRLFEEGGERSRLVSQAPISTIVAKLEKIAKDVDFTVRKKDCTVTLEGSPGAGGVKGPLTISAEIFELTPLLVIVEVKKKGGDKRAYDDFLNRTLKPSIESLRSEEGTLQHEYSKQVSLKREDSEEGTSFVRGDSEQGSSFKRDDYEQGSSYKRGDSGPV